MTKENALKSVLCIVTWKWQAETSSREKKNTSVSRGHVLPRARNSGSNNNSRLEGIDFLDQWSLSFQEISCIVEGLCIGLVKSTSVCLRPPHKTWYRIDNLVGGFRINAVYTIKLQRQTNFNVSPCIFIHYILYKGPTNALVFIKTLIHMSHTKTFKITPTCFDHQTIIVRELSDPG
jgi:hypothetical protein